MTNTEIDKGERKVEIAIDKMVDLQDMGFGTDEVQRILDLLNSLWSEIESKRVDTV